MSDPTSNPNIFDVERIRLLVELMKEHDMSEIDLRDGETRIQIRRGGEPVVTAMAPRPAVAAGGPATVVEVAMAPAAVKPAEENVAVIKSPMVGTFYTAPDPDSKAYVKVGDHVGPDTIVCIVEAMKVFNQIPAEVSGKIVAVLVENGQPVEFGQPLFKVDTRA